MKRSFEELPPQLCQDQIRNRLLLLEKTIKSRTDAVTKAPGGRIRCVVKKKHVEFYLITKKCDNNGKYLKKENIVLARNILQRDYNKKVLSVLRKEGSLLQKLIFLYDSMPVEKVVETFSHSKRSFITPVTLSAKDYIKLWTGITYKGKSFLEGQPQYFSLKGLQVRSKSEVIIANTLDHFGIPFRYEFPVKLKNEHGSYIDFYPDFYCLNLSSRKEIVWEHFGMMSDPEYSENAVHKIRMYQANNFFPGDNFIFTMETNEQPVNVKELEKIIKKYLL